MSVVNRYLPSTREDRFATPRLLAVGSVGLLVAAYLRVLLFVITVTGNPLHLALVVGSSVGAATVFARLLTLRRALLLATLALLVGAYLYVTSLPANIEVYGKLSVIVTDSLALLTGLSILRIVNAGVWALAVAPAPTFFAWYLAVRGRYSAAVAVAGATLGVFVLTGDADATTTLIGVLGAAGALGFGDLDRRDGSLDSAEVIAVVLAVAVLVSFSVTVVPVPAGAGGGGGVFSGFGGAQGSASVEASLVSAGDDLKVLGSVELSPEVRFTVTSEQPGYWKVNSYDRYTGQGWVRTGGARPYEGRLSSPPGRNEVVDQRFTMETTMTVMPALWKPTTAGANDVPIRVLDEGSLRPATPLSTGDGYAVTSRVVNPSPRTLRTAGTDYPDEVEQRYLQLPENLPERVADRTSRITANADNPYDIARVSEQWLENNKRYSLDVERPRGDTADAFLFEMDAGYCTYFATTMVTMLRTQGIPARLAVGYTTGEQVARDRWVARGLDAHAWVEVYFPDVGWVRFDPTPAGPRTAAEQARLEEARANNESNVDTVETGPEAWTPTPTPTPETPRRVTPTPEFGNQSRNTTPTPDFSQFRQTPFGGTDANEGFSIPELPPREELALWSVVGLGAVAAARRSGLGDRAYRAVWLRYQPRRDPVADIEGAYRRAEYVLSRRVRPRRAGETVRQYAASVGDERARRLATLYEEAKYAGRASESAADEAVSLADDLR
ncbi:transglutaminase TgpA family protein [Natronomonas sp. EA1]|uniref:transglutaminase TgpA family protein n=1 Tax=Natronomonas sp. EA1 TaxID=3421655 RepID=UPI003EBD6AAD